jgi:hypothetical protein
MSEEASDARLDPIVEQHDDFEDIDGNEAAEQLDITLDEFGELVENDPRFEFGASPRFPWVNMETYRKWDTQQDGQGDNQ